MEFLSVPDRPPPNTEPSEVPEPESLLPRDVLRREFDRLAELTDESYRAMLESGTHIAEKAYQGWAALLLRYHNAMMQDEGKESGVGLPTMKV